MVSSQAKDRSLNQQPLDKVSVSFDVWQKRIEHALRNITDRSVLNRSPLARLAYIKRLVAEQYVGHLLPHGLALHDVLLASVKRISTELADEPGLTRACKYLQLLVQGLSCQEISNQLGLSREHVSRIYRKKAIELMTEEFLSTIKNDE